MRMAGEEKTLMKEDILKYIFDRSVTQKKRIEKVFSAKPEMELELENFLKTYKPFMENKSVCFEDLAEAYLSVVNQMIVSRIKFIRTGQYPASSQEDAAKNIYSDEKAMTRYMLGLALSQFLWAHHYKVFKFYQDILAYPGKRGAILEVGSGHGLFTIEFLNKNGIFDSMDIVDISEASLDITRSIIKTLKPDNIGRINFLRHDIKQFTAKKLYDFITMGEVLEHVEDPLGILRHLHRILNDEGTIFVSTCANSPAVDHVYHFKSIPQIRAMINGAGFEIVKDIVVPSEDKTESEIEKLKLDVLYAALIKKSG